MGVYFNRVQLFLLQPTISLSKPLPKNKQITFAGWETRGMPCESLKTGISDSFQLQRARLKWKSDLLLLGFQHWGHWNIIITLLVNAQLEDVKKLNWYEIESSHGIKMAGPQKMNKNLQRPRWSEIDSSRLVIHYLGDSGESSQKKVDWRIHVIAVLFGFTSSTHLHVLTSSRMHPGLHRPPGGIWLFPFLGIKEYNPSICPPS